MIVDRIRNLKIDDRPIFTGLYGCLYGQEYFVEDNLCKYSYWQELYRYLRGEGYTTVFYNEAYNFYSYEESQLETLFFKKPEEISKETGAGLESGSGSTPHGRYVSQFPSPNGHNRRKGIRLSGGGSVSEDNTNSENRVERSTPNDTSSTDLVSHNPGILVKTIEHGKNKNGDQFFQFQSRVRVMDKLFGFMDNNPGHKLAVVFTMPSKISFGQLEPSYHSDFQGRFSQQEYAGSGLRCLVLYDFKEVTQLYESLQQGGAFFLDTWYKNQMFPDHQEGRSDLHKPSPALFRVGSMGKDEVGNMLKRRRVMDGLSHTMSPTPFDDLCALICQQFVVEDPETEEKTSIETVAEFMKLPIDVVERTILKMDEEKAINKLKRMLGIDKLIEQFERYIKAYHRAQKNKKEPFRPHMAFMGNPGTGKTTVARLFAGMLREEGLLSRGHFVEAKPGDLIAEHIGGTRIKTQAVCDRAQGGVLFIDEAYGLMSGANDNGNVNFGTEAIEVLIQFMENNKDSLVIVAGYPDETKRLINEGNPGFKSRFSQDLGFFHFEDYEPNVLYQIAKKNIPDYIKTTPAFDKALRDIVVLKHAYRTKNFGNARDMENLASTIVSTYEDAEVDGPLDIIHLPDALRVLVDPSMLKEDIMLAELNDKIVGQENIRKIVKDLYVRCLAERTKMYNIEGYKPELLRLNYIFAGNPGTGKTTIARIIGNLLQKMGVLSSNDNAVLTEIFGGDVAQMSPSQIDKLFEDNIGKVLFIDEAYMLRENPQVIAGIVQNATSKDYQNKLCVILAGYTVEMHQMMRLNPGMFSRFDEVLFQNYTNKELWEILKRKINAPGSQYLIEDVCRKTAINYFASLHRGRDFGNARIVGEDLIPILTKNQGARYINANEEQRRTSDFAKRILPEDFPPTRIVGDDFDLTPLERLNRMQGIDNIRAQFQQYRNAFKRFKEGKGGKSFRPHMAFMGNPGTGKTTVARLFGEILHEEELLPQGQFVEATVGDMISQYVGETRVKAGALCDQARGGVLFIDEAYGLMSGAGGHGADFGQEAIEVLIQFMENNTDSLVIVAGYPEETKRLINDGNPGFKSRFNDSLGFFYFEDYKPDVLYKIARCNIPESIMTTPEFDQALRNIIVLKHAYRTKVFGNARDMENLANTIVSAYQDANDNNPLDVTHLPERLRVLVDSTMLNEQTMLSELNDKIIGQEDVKEIVRDLFCNCLAQRTRMAEIEGYTPTLQRLNFVFYGNPGTGKTTVARIIGNLLQKMGVLSSNDDSVLTEKSGGDITRMTPAEIKDLFEDNIGKVLFIDEAYALDGHPQVISEIVQNVTNRDYENKMCVIMAGYTAEMRQMMRTNPGVSSRFTPVIFKNYTDEQLWEILKVKVADSQLLMDEEACKEKALNYFASLPRGRDFGNARIIEADLLPSLRNSQDKRYAQATPEQRRDPDFAMRILTEDFPAARQRSKNLTQSPVERLNNMLGIENVWEQFERYRAAYKQYCLGQGSDTFRPHMAFMGNPGTGKTTVARLFGSILHEDGLLPQGQFVEAKVGDLVGQYIGETRVKAAALCDQAKGGVLFIDEAYGLMSGAGVHGADYGKEAIEVLIQFMENNNDSLVILAGYPDEILNLINNGNPGFRSRFNESFGFFYFNDYEPDALYKIARGKIPESIQTTPAFEQALRNIIILKHAYRTKVFGNARDMENLANAIVSVYQETNISDPLDVIHLPEQLRLLVDSSMLNEETMLAELNENIVGQENIKTLVRNLYHKCKAERDMMSRDENHRPELQRLNYIFLGNPGTGKTTLARIIGNLLQKIGVLSSNDNSVLTEISGAELTHMRPAQIDQLFQENIGKVLFIDEAYQLGDNPQTIAEIVKNATDLDYQNKMCVILAGYTKEMHEMMGRNSGMFSRFDEVTFHDYSNQELWEILKRKVNAPESQFIMDEAACEHIAIKYFKSQPRSSHFGNARIITDILLPVLKINLYRRYNIASEEEKNNPDFAKQILPEDFPQDTLTSSMSDEEVLRDLNSLVGLEKVKRTINDIIANVKVQYQRSQARNTNESKIGLNFVFRGNPGTGKTTVARLLGNILANYGLISSPEVVTYTKGDLVDGYEGGGARNVEQMFEDSVGKVLFIDEAYQLADQDQGSKEALDTLTNMLTDERFKDQLAIVLAGYHGEMAELINKNPGLKSRFTQYIDFDDYSNDELTDIFHRKLTSEGFSTNEDALAHARAFFSSLPHNTNFANAREAVNLLEKVKLNQGRRMLTLASTTEDELFTILPKDFPNFGKINVDAYRSQQGSALSPMDKLNRLIGIESIREKFERYVKRFKNCRNNPQARTSRSFRPHMAFLGNPGTGKTTVARLFGEILCAEGLLTSNNFVEVGPTDLIGEYLGHTGPKARRQFERARGGILFIDEAYQLCRKDQVHGGDQYGKEVVTELQKFMEDERDTIVILAGYTNETRYLIQHGNSGLASRVTNEFLFADYEPDVLCEILLNVLSEHEMTDEFKTNIRQIVQYEYEHRNEQWGNARTMENFANDIFDIYLNLRDGEGPIDSDCIPGKLKRGLSQGAAQQTSSTSMSTDNQLTPRTTLQSIDLSQNPADRRVTNKRQLREQATGLLHSSDGEGTGFIFSITDRYILTCSHVVEAAGNDLLFIMNCKEKFETMAHLVWNNRDQDMAILQLDELPEYACFVQLDGDTAHDPDPSDSEERIKLVLCSYPAGSNLASTPSINEGKIMNYEKGRQWNERCFDTILTSINATHGCSGGPVVRESDFLLVGLLQGGMSDSNIQFITDIHQLFRNIEVKS